MHPGIHRTLSSCLLKSYERHIFLRQHYLYQVQRVKTIRFTLRLTASPFSDDYTTVIYTLQHKNVKNSSAKIVQKEKDNKILKNHQRIFYSFQIPYLIKFNYQESTDNV